MLRSSGLGETIRALHRDHFSVYGVRKLWRALRREGEAVGRDQGGRLMRVLGLAGVTRTQAGPDDAPCDRQRAPG